MATTRGSYGVSTSQSSMGPHIAVGRGLLARRRFGVSQTTSRASEPAGARAVATYAVRSRKEKRSEVKVRVE